MEGKKAWYEREEKDRGDKIKRGTKTEIEA